jgi:hypothetical protein
VCVALVCVEDSLGSRLYKEHQADLKEGIAELLLLEIGLKKNTAAPAIASQSIIQSRLRSPS